VPSHALVGSPTPSGLLVEVVSLPTLPEGAHTSPLTLLIAPKDAQTITVQSNAPVTTPRFASATMEFVVEMIALRQMPVFANCNPSSTIPAATNSLPVEMAIDTTIRAPKPFPSLVIVVLAPHMPICANASPLPLVISPTNTVAVQVNSNTTVTSPRFTGSAVQLMVVMVATVKMPVLPHNDPTTTCPTLQDSQAVQVPCDSAVTSPTPTTSFVIVVLLPQLPELADGAPLALSVAPDDALAVLVDTNAPEATPGLPCAPM